MPIVQSTHQVNGEQIKINIEMDRAPAALGAAPQDPYGATRAVTDKVLESAHDYFSDGMLLARTCAASVVESLGQLGEKVRPQEFEVKLAIKLDAEAGAVLAKVGAEAQLEVTLKWTRSTKA
jgi:hypothetical protein